MSDDTQLVSPITMEDRIDPVTAQSPEITEQGGEHNINRDVTKNEYSVYDAPRPRQTKTGLSWRTRLAGRSATVHVDELENGEYSSLVVLLFLALMSNCTMQALPLLPMSRFRTRKLTSRL
jgi:hypothetical protein